MRYSVEADAAELRNPENGQSSAPLQEISFAGAAFLLFIRRNFVRMNWITAMRYFWPRLLNKLNILHYFNLVQQVRTNGVFFNIPIYDKIGFDNLFLSEMWMVDVLDRLLAKDREICFVDVGANIGQTLLKVRSVRKNVDYIGFEPNMTCLSYLDHLIKLNGFTKCAVFPFGLADKEECLELNYYSESGSDSSASMIRNFRPDMPVKYKHKIWVDKLDRVMNQSVDMIKIDVEGAELFVIKGGIKLIQKYSPYILCEGLPGYDQGNVVRLKRQEELQVILDSLGYSIFQSVQDHKYLRKLGSFYIHSSLELCDYVFVPSNQIVSFSSRCGDFIQS